MKSLKLFSGLLLAQLVVVTGCDLKSHTTWTHSSSLDRKFLHSISNGIGSLRIEIETDYLGKAPVPPNEGQIEHTDFYNYRLHNLSSNAVELTSITLAYKEVESGAVFKTLDANAIWKEFGTTVIAPGATFIHTNARVKNTNGAIRTLVRTYHGVCAGQSVELPVKLLYRPGQ